MDPLKVSAQFAAYVWYTNGKQDDVETRRGAESFARENWVAFLPLAHEGMGRLLMRIAKRPRDVMAAARRCRGEAGAASPTPKRRKQPRRDDHVCQDNL